MRGVLVSPGAHLHDPVVNQSSPRNGSNIGRKVSPEARGIVIEPRRYNGLQPVAQVVVCTTLVLYLPSTQVGNESAHKAKNEGVKAKTRAGISVIKSYSC
jgi:hypothetical protein